MFSAIDCWLLADQDHTPDYLMFSSEGSKYQGIDVLVGIIPARGLNVVNEFGVVSPKYLRNNASFHQPMELKFGAEERNNFIVAPMPIEKRNQASRSRDQAVCPLKDKPGNGVRFKGIRQRFSQAIQKIDETIGVEGFICQVGCLNFFLKQTSKHQRNQGR